MRAILSGSELTDKYDHKKIAIMLKNFAQQNVRLMPEKMVEVHDDPTLMIDLVRVRHAQVILPVAIKSTRWLIIAHRLSDQHALAFAHDEYWPLMNRISLIGGLADIAEENVVEPLLSYLRGSLDHWKIIKKENGTYISERVHELLSENADYEQFKEAPVIALDESYKKAEVLF